MSDDELCSVWDAKTHVSISLEDSCKWYAKQIERQQQMGGLFDDPFFKADSESIGPNLIARGNTYEWNRPHDIVANPQFVTDGVSRFDVVQGGLADCWFLSAVASLSVHQQLLDEVIPKGQSFCSETSGLPHEFPYCGMFWFRVWRYGHWLDVVIDDQLPTRNKKLIFMRSADSQEFWSALLEKAYVKTIGSYDMLDIGTSAEGMEDLTGGISELVALRDKTPKNLFSMMLIAHSRLSLMGSIITEKEFEGTGPLGLVTQHCYSITDVRKVNTMNGDVELVRLRNPWGNSKEWCGPWSDGSEEWETVPESERELLEVKFDKDGEFWMSLNDFATHFTRIEFCHVGPESGGYGHSLAHSGTRRWEMRHEVGEWVRGSSAGGCLKYKDTFHTNPQYRVTITDPDETDKDDFGTIIVGLMQTNMRETKRQKLCIGYVIFRIPPDSSETEPLGQSFFEGKSPVAKCRTFTYLREIVTRHELEPGEYVIVPSATLPDDEATFLLRIFSERAHS